MAGKNEFRKTQGIAPYGVGSIIDFPEESLMPAGLDMWPSETDDFQFSQRVIQATQIVDERLQKRLSVNRGRSIKKFLSPIEAPENLGHASVHSSSVRGYMPFIRFPEWHFCPRCRAMWHVPWNTPTGSDRLRCHGTMRLRNGTGRVCNELPDRYKPKLVPLRFVVACESGHIMDFPWNDWVPHDVGCASGPGQLFFVSTVAAGLSGVRVECGLCNKSNSLANAFSRGAFNSIWPQGCPGKRPWLGPDADELCSSTPSTVQRGASNIHFSTIVSSILVPPYSMHLRATLARPDVWGVIESLPRVNGLVNSKNQTLIFIANQHGVSSEQIASAANEKLGNTDAVPHDIITEDEYRFTEYKAFLGPRPSKNDRGYFDIIGHQMEEYSEDFRRFVDKVVLIPKLKETRVMTGFTRLVPSGSEHTGKISSLSLNQKDWLPAVDVYGEGIFLTLRDDVINSWMADSEEISKRVKSVNSHLKDVCITRGIEVRTVSAKFLLIHTLSHLLIRQLTFDCGYDSSSLSERLYVCSENDINMSGFLIYTASGDSEGSLGGLVRQGEPGRLEATLFAAIENAKVCSTDPLCIESEGQGTNSLNLGACHACCLLPETACEEGNQLLDRGMVIGTDTYPKTAFFF